MAVPPPFPRSDSATADAKAALRARLRAARQAFASPEATAALCARLAGGTGPVAGYVAHRGEPDLAAVLHDAHRDGRIVALPRIGRDGTMRFVAWTPGAPLDRGPLGIAQPADGDALVPQTLLMPLLGFDRRGARLGQGGGHYDRWCAAHPGVRRIGIGWSVQEVDALPVDPWDQPLDAVVTEREWIEM